MACMQVELDDDCLLTIMSFLSPLPDLISLSKACRVRSIYVTNVHVRKYVVVKTKSCTPTRHCTLNSSWPVLCWSRRACNGGVQQYVGQLHICMGVGTSPVFVNNP